MTGKEDSIDGNDFSRFEEEDISDEDIVDRHELLGSASEDLDVSSFLLRTESEVEYQLGKNVKKEEIAKETDLSFWN